jgi:hypothetical protein
MKHYRLRGGAKGWGSSLFSKTFSEDCTPLGRIPIKTFVARHPEDWEEVKEKHEVDPEIMLKVLRFCGYGSTIKATSIFIGIYKTLEEKGAKFNIEDATNIINKYNGE